MKKKHYGVRFPSTLQFLSASFVFRRSANEHPCTANEHPCTANEHPSASIVFRKPSNEDPCTEIELRTVILIKMPI